MIEHPESLRVSRSRADEARVTGLVREWIEKGGADRKEGLHASDLLDPRLAYWKHVDPKPLDDRLVWVFATGRALHAVILAAWGGEEGATDQGSEWSEVLGLWYSPDAKEDDGSPTELKTSRTFFEPKDVEKDLGLYLEQLLVYMVAEDRTTGWVKVLLMNRRDEDGKTSPEIRCYRVTVSPEDLVALRGSMTALSASIAEAITLRDWTKLPVCRAWKCGEQCAYWSSCKPEGRYPKKTRKAWSA